MVNTLFLPELREMLAKSHHGDLVEFCTALNPARTAEFMEGLTPSEAWRVLQHVDPPRRAEIFEYFDYDRQVEILRTEDPGQLAELIVELAADDRADLVQELRGGRVAELLPLLPKADRRDIQRLTSYPEGTAGAVMTTEVAKLAEHLTVREALEELSHQAEMLETIYYIYVVDDDDQLRGVVSGRQLISALGHGSTPLSELMETDVMAVLVTEDQESVAQKVEKFDLLAIPVVDAGRHLLGIITHDDVIDVLREEMTEDAQRFGGITPLRDDYLRINLLLLSWKRGMWLTILFFTALLTAFALRAYEAELESYVWIVAFIPLIVSTGGNSGNQSATLVITALTSGEVTVQDWLRVLRRELLVGLLLGVILALFGLLIALIFAPTAYGALLIPATLVLVVTGGCLTGSMLPLIFQRLGLDPALMANPFIAGIMDIMGILIYVNIARLLLGATATVVACACGASCPCIGEIVGP